MIRQETHPTEHFDEQPTLMDWCQDQLKEIRCQPADPPILAQDQWKLKETSSYGKSSCVLPITFFDIQSNIQLLNKCNPLSIQVVDCDKHPWYYKKYMRVQPPEKSVVKMDNTKEPSNKKNEQLVGEDVVQYIDLTENTCDVFANVYKTTANFNKLATNENKMPPINTKKKKNPHNVPKLTISSPLDKEKACSQVDLSKIDLKHNTGLVGLRITNTIDLKNNSVSAKNYKRKKTVARKTENEKVDECFTAASKALNLLGTIIVPVDTQEQIQKVVDKRLPDNNYESRVASQSSAQITVFKPKNAVKPGPKSVKKHRLKNKKTLLPDIKYGHKVPSQSSAQIIVSKPKNAVKPGPKSVTKQHLKNKNALLPVNNKSVNDKLKSNSQGKHNSQPLKEKTNEHVKIAKVTAIPENVKEILKQAELSCARVNKTKIHDQTNGTGTEEMSRSKSPIFPCNSKNKIQSELEKHLKLNHAKLNHNQENNILVKDSAKSVLKCREPSTTGTLHDNDNVNKNAIGNFNETRSEQTKTKVNNGKNIKNAHDNEYAVHIDPVKRVISIADVTTPSNTSTKYKPKSSYECTKTTYQNFNTNPVIQRNGASKNAKTASATNGMISQMKCQKNSSNNTNIQIKPDLIMNEGKEKFVALLQKHFASINKKKHAPSVSGKPEMNPKGPPPSTALPLPVETVKTQLNQTKMNLPIQSQVSNRPEFDTGCHAPRVSGKPEMIPKAPPPNTALPLPVRTVKTQPNQPKMNLLIQSQVSNRPEIDTECHAPKVSGKPEMIPKAPLPNTALPLPVETVKTQPNQTNRNLPIQSQVSNRPEFDTGCTVPSAFTSQNMNARLPKQPVRSTQPAYCKVNGISNSFVRHPNILLINPMHLENPNMHYARWNPHLYFPIPPFMHPPSLFLPPPPLPTSIEKFQNTVHSLRNVANTPSDEVRKNAASNLEDVLTTAKPKTDYNTGNNNRIPDKIKNKGNSSLSLPSFVSQDKTAAKETQSKEQKILSLVPNLPPAPSKPDMPSVHHKKTMFVGDQRHNLSEKNDTSHNNRIPNNRDIIRDITLIPVRKASVLNCASTTNTKISKNNTNEYVNRDDKTSEGNKKNDGSSPYFGKNDLFQMNKSNEKPKPGPLCMKNKTGPFAVETPPNSQPKKGYSPPILPIPTFQTILAQTHDLQVSMRLEENPHLSQFSYPPAHHRTPNSCVADKSSRKRSHFDDKGVNEVKRVKKISYADYKNRCSKSDKTVGLPKDPTDSRKYARKSENSCKSVKSLADVVNQGVGMNFSKDTSFERNSAQILEI